MPRKVLITGIDDDSVNHLTFDSTKPQTRATMYPSHPSLDKMVIRIGGASRFKTESQKSNWESKSELLGKDARYLT